MRATPKHTAPELRVKTLDGNEWSLAEQKSENFTLLVFYRGLHCPICKKYLQQLHELSQEFNQNGVDVVAISMDTEKRARLSRKDWALEDMKLGYGLSKESAIEWGLYLSQGVKDGEPEVFSEPGLFLIDNNNQVYASNINSNPWGRPYLPTYLKAVQFVIKSGYPARGEMV